MSYFRYGLNHPLVSTGDEDIGGVINKISASTFVTGTNITYSGARGSQALWLAGTYSAAAGGFHNLYSIVNTSGVFLTDNDGVVNIKAVTVNSAALTDGSIYGGQFIAKKTGAGTAANESAHIGVEGWFYETDSGIVGTGIGGNFGWHADSTAASHQAGSVWRGIQVFCDNAGTSDAAETSALCFWNQAGTIDQAMNLVNSGSGFTFFAKLPDDDAPGKIGTYSSGVAANPTGYIAVQIASSTRYIYLFTTKPS